MIWLLFGDIMVNSYETVAARINDYQTENNLGELVKEENEKKYKEFYNWNHQDKIEDIVRKKAEYELEKNNYNDSN